MYSRDLSRAVAAEMLADPIAQQQVAALPVSYASTRSPGWLLPFLAGAITVGITTLVAVLIQRR